MPRTLVGKYCSYNVLPSSFLIPVPGGWLWGWSLRLLTLTWGWGACLTSSSHSLSWLSDQGPGDRGTPAARGEHQACGQGYRCWADQADADPQRKQPLLQWGGSPWVRVSALVGAHSRRLAIHSGFAYGPSIGWRAVPGPEEVIWGTRERAPPAPHPHHPWGRPPCPCNDHFREVEFPEHGAGLSPLYPRCVDQAWRLGGGRPFWAWAQRAFIYPPLALNRQTLFFNVFDSPAELFNEPIFITVRASHQGLCVHVCVCVRDA